MTDTTIRIDGETARLIAELAHLMENTKKAVMADAVASYARGRLPALANGRIRYGDLSPRERLALRRDELLRQFERHGTSSVRVLDDTPPNELGARSDSLILLAETDIMLGGEAAPLLADLARRLLDTPVEVISSTKLSLFDPERLEQLIAESAPL
jgi:hypothetical protein